MDLFNNLGVLKISSLVGGIYIMHISPVVCLASIEKLK